MAKIDEIKNEGTKSNIIYVPLTRLYPHPNNPRKDLGDLTELADSVKKSGILQPLLVVPYGKSGKEYTTIAGHRRRAAANLAGLLEVPCIVTDLDEKEQRYIMYIENEQRSSLTVTEQAQFVQEMINFGESIEDIAASTGISQSTIRRRAKIAKYDKDKVERSFSRGATIEDYEKLEKVKDPELRAEVFESIGTNNFEWRLRSAIEKERNNNWLDSVEVKIRTFATKIFDKNQDKSDLKIVDRYSVWLQDKEINEYYDDEYTFFYERDNMSITVYRELTDDELKDVAEDTAKKQQKEEEEKGIKMRLEAIARQAYECRSLFVKGLHIENTKYADFFKFVCRSIIDGRGYRIDADKYVDFIGLIEEEKEKDIYELLDRIPTTKALLLVAYLNTDDNQHRNYYSTTDCSFCGNVDLDIIYDFLTRWGYELSDEERAWKEGTLEI